MGVALLAGLLPGSVRAQDEDGRALAFFEPVAGALNQGTPAEEWTFEGHADQVISVLAVRTSGDLDPTLAVIGPGGRTVAENDDLDSLVRDAGLEALSLPQDGTYTIWVTRYGGEDGTTAGEYELTLTPGFAQLARTDDFEAEESPWLSSELADSITLLQGQLRLRAASEGDFVLAVPADAEPVENHYMQVDVRLPTRPSYAEVGLAFRVQTGTSGLQAYQFRVNTEGEWSVVFEDGSGRFVLQTWTEHEALEGTAWTLAVLARADEFTFYANGTRLGTLSDTRITGPGRFGLLAATRAEQPDLATVAFDNLLLTTRLGTTYRGLPLALETWDSRLPEEIVAELSQSGLIQPAGARDLFVADGRLASTDQTAQFELIGSAQARYTDFLLGATVRTVTTGESVACGLVYRWQDARNTDLVFVDTAGGFGLSQTRDAELTANVYDFSPAVLPDASNLLLIVARGEQTALYINGTLVTQETVTPGSGRVGLALLNYEDVGTDCYFLEVWVWPLAGE